MTTEFVLMTVELQTTGIALRNHIESQLRTYGEPLRWAITSVEKTTAQIEAVVTVVPKDQA
ncbi:hypothetical protein D0962_13515 [Leptolyngbyaceae cyanobacterium CCMR0082]|uniref:Uncharacterized protein n=2 Tax=Adonisia turfae TaxID=2950184 RepID=A0A6M0S7I9_9CYAN|nr:hypothetical protein [Adonisia turfae]NEZ56783.1 hypothetical protein [Adonisia turfae CCMR0081]NEZ63792.1 hypothetical protein [Adonisia turfae CCMR0082]